MGDLTPLTRDPTRAPCSGSAQSEPPDSQGIPLTKPLLGPLQVIPGQACL